MPMLPIAILAGGLATRLGPLTQKIPKSLIPIAGEPFLAHQLRLLQKNGIQHVILCVGHLGEMIQHAIGNGSRFRIDTSNTPTTAPHCKAQPERSAPPCQSWEIVFSWSMATPTCPAIIAAIAQEFARSRKPGLMTVFRNEGQWDTSNVEFEDGRILAYSKTNRTSAHALYRLWTGSLPRRSLHAIAKPPIWPTSTPICFRPAI